MATRGSSRTKKGSSPRRRGGSRQNFSQGKIDSLNLSDDRDHSTSRGTSTQPNNDMALVHSHLPVESSASTVEENPQHVSPAPEPFPTRRRRRLTSLERREVAAKRGLVCGNCRTKRIKVGLLISHELCRIAGIADIVEVYSCGSWKGLGAHYLQTPLLPNVHAPPPQ
jgi:hypothetical protein